MMRIKTLFGTLLCGTYTASGSSEPVERYYASMFESYFDQLDAQPSCAAVQAILRGERLPPRKLLRHYWDIANPRCPGRLMEDLTALYDCCFASSIRRTKLRELLEAFLSGMPEEDAEDLRQLIDSGDIVQLWTCLTWYALCGDHCG